MKHLNASLPPRILARIHWQRLGLSAASGFELNLDLDLPGEGVVALFGHSGSGKTTLLRWLAGLEAAEGYLSINGDIWQDENRCLPAHKRSVGFVFQQPGLFPHLTVAGNLKYALKRRGSGFGSGIKDHGDIIDLLGIGHLLERSPEHLSGGEQQRVAIARALLIQPQLLLMDEPLAALDQPRKQEILPYLDQLRQHLQIPLLYVTHAIAEVTRLADYVVVMEQGHVCAQGTLNQVFAAPQLPGLTADDAGAVVAGRVSELDQRWQLARVELNGGDLWLNETNLRIGDPLRLRIAARDVSISLQQDRASSILNRLPAIATDICPLDAASSLVRLQLVEPVSDGGVSDAQQNAGENTALLAQITQRSQHQLGLRPGLLVWAQVKSAAIVR